MSEQYHYGYQDCKEDWIAKIRLIIDTTKDMINDESMKDHKEICDNDGIIYKEIVDDTIDILEALLIAEDDNTTDEDNTPSVIDRIEYIIKEVESKDK